MKIDPGLKRQIKLMIQKSDDALKAATILTRAESFDAAAARYELESLCLFAKSQADQRKMRNP